MWEKVKDLGICEAQNKNLAQDQTMNAQYDNTRKQQPMTFVPIM